MSPAEITELLHVGAGDDPGPVDVEQLWVQGRRRRRAKLTGAVVAAAAVVAAVVAGRVLVVPTPSVDIGPVDQSPLIDDVVLPGEAGTSRATLVPLSEETGSVVLVAGDGQLSVVDVDTGETTQRELPELAAGDPPYRLVAGQRLVLYGGDTIYAMDTGLGSAPEAIVDTGSFGVFVPSGLPDRVWVRAGRTDGAAAAIRQIDLQGETLLGPATSPGGNLAIGLVDTVVLQRNDQLIVWDPATDEIVHEVPGPFPMGTDGQRFAWCDAGCRALSLSGPSTATVTVARLPDGYTFGGYSGRVSPDGHYLATPVCHDGPEDRCALTVIDLANAQSWTIADGWMNGADHLAWAPDSSWLFMASSEGRLVTYRPGDSEASLVPVPPTLQPFDLAVVAAPETDDPAAVVLDGDRIQTLAAAATHDPSLKGHVVLDSQGLASVWDMASVAGPPPTLPDGTIGVFVVARQAESTCRSPNDVLGVRVDDLATVLLDRDGEFMRPCPGPAGSHAYTAFVIAIPDEYADQLGGATSQLASTSD